MDQTHKDALQSCRQQLVEEIIFEELADAIICENVFTATMMEKIQAGETRGDKVRRLLNDLPRRGPKAYDIFIKCLRSTEQGHLADTIVKEAETLRKDETNEQLKRYRDNERKLFVESPAFKQCQANCETKGHTAIFGAPGDGKTTIGLEMLCRVRDTTNKKTIIISNDEDWKKVDLSSSTGQELVILFDDMLGKFVLNENLKNFWLSRLEKIHSFVQNRKIQVIITCRETIFSTAINELESFELFNEKSRIYLSGSNCKYPLDKKTQFNIIKKYIQLGKNIEICGDEDEQILSPPSDQNCRISVGTLRKISKKSYVGYMQMCKVFVSEKLYYSQGAGFFDRAADFMVREINRLRSSREEDEKYNYCTLACVVVKQGLNVDQIDGDETVCKIAKSCRIESTSILTSEINLAAKRLTSTYFIKINDKYQFQHNSWIESVFKSFLESNPSLLFKYCKFGLIEDLVTTKDNGDKSAGLCELSASQYISLFQRLVSEIADRNLRRVFSHRCFTDANFSRTFCNWLDSDKELKQAVLMSGEPDRNLGWTPSRIYDTNRSVLYWAARECDVTFIIWAENGLRQLGPKSWNWFGLRQSGTRDMKWEMSSALLSACRGGNFSVCAWLLSQTGIDVSDWCILLAASSGNVNVVKTLLNLDKTFSSHDLSRGLYEACRRGNIDVCYEILTQPEVSRGVMWGKCLSEAAKRRYIDVVSTLINYGQFASDDLSRILYRACERGDIDVCNEILTHPGIEKGLRWDDCWSLAIERGNIDLVTALINYGQLTSHDLSCGLYRACILDDIDVRNAILTQSGVDKGEWWCKCLGVAAGRGNIDVVTTLMNYAQLKKDDLSYGLYKACLCDRFDVFSLLLTQPRVRGASWRKCLIEAAKREQFKKDSRYADLIRSKGYRVELPVYSPNTYVMTGEELRYRLELSGDVSNTYAITGEELRAMFGLKKYYRKPWW